MNTFEKLSMRTFNSACRICLCLEEEMQGWLTVHENHLVTRLYNFIIWQLGSVVEHCHCNGWQSKHPKLEV